MIRLGALGDVVRSLPAVSALRSHYSGARLVWLVEPASASLLESQPWIDEVFVFPRDELRKAFLGFRWLRALRILRSFLRDLRQQRFDVVVDFHAIIKSALLSKLSGAARRVSYARPFARELSWLFATERAQLPKQKLSRFVRNQLLVEYLAVAYRPAPKPLVVSAEQAKQFQASRGAIVLHPGSSPHTAHKRYPLAAYQQVLEGLDRRGLGPILVSYGPSASERATAERLVELAKGVAQLSPATRSVVELGALLSQAALYIGGDTGPMHVASLVGTPVLQLLGPTDPVENGPYPLVPSRTLRVDVGCNPCRRGCAAATCMRAISPDQVVRAATELLGQKTGVDDQSSRQS